MEMLVAGSWRGAADGRIEEIRSPFDGRIVDTVPVATVKDAVAALDRAEIGARIQRSTPAHERVDILLRAAALADERAEDIAQTISAESGKPITEARGESSRSGNIIRLAAYEGSQLYGSSLPLDANAGTGLDKIGFTLRQPVGIVVAITPFNYPALLVLHKIAPALAAGNAVVLKPARATPLTALKLARCFVDAGLPPEALSVITGPGSSLGDVLVTDPRVRKVSFTGSTSVGTRISSIAGVKKLSLELGASCPVIILPDADLELAATAVASGGYVNAGQVCISVQRVIVDRRVEADFLDALVPKVEAIAVGDPRADGTRLGSLISVDEATRVQASIAAARQTGARVLTGGDRDGAVVSPAVVAGVDPRSPLSRDELFGPAVAVSSAQDIEGAIAQANDNDYGLGAGIFTNDVAGTVQAMRSIDAGNIHINWSPLWRADLMPYGGLKGSGVGKEGVRSAVQEMTEEKTIVLHGRPW
ncbi:glyceraldehyde-3-phosphate dehydrogenase (NADP+) [Arthrobacter silviterrae]|uniref:Aldehyde dehydrogenase family protein n=1 Tax=Arthrobacter silviterrae TaxID=2026658 RepID=A0ABX0DJK2_9MICC|nr:aldehyde dehydrogenase family protein [Arthrobacter silviterrae]MDQ0276506.1 glyceraldehyde-3-phosphate dehydrogenase (NADP+) [Arthrobacter silviterrae]NGN85539.1 aldehyde dehydrogenase family protein [Arthrobacter silviterrae]